MNGDSPFRLGDQEVEKSIVYELPSNGNNMSAYQPSGAAKKYTMKQ